MTWAEMSEDAYRAAKILSQRKFFRSSVSRAYFAAYAAFCAEFSRERQIEFGFGGNNPSHDALLNLVRNNLDRTRYSKNVCWNLAKAIRRLRHLRLLADYAPAMESGEKEARACVRDARYIMDLLGLETRS